MVGNNQWNSIELLRPATHAPNRFVTGKQILRGNAANGEYDLRLHQLDLALEIGPARCRFVGVRVTIVGRPDFKILAIKTSSRLWPMARSISSSNLPALPTNGSPRRSSSAPGASPMTSQSAFGLPTPKTVFVRLADSPQRVHTLTFSRSDSQSRVSAGM